MHHASAARGGVRKTQRINYCRRNASRITIWNRDFTRYDHERGITFSFTRALALSVPVHFISRPFRAIAPAVQIAVHSKNGFKQDWVINLKSVANCRPFMKRAKRPACKWDNQFCHFPQPIYAAAAPLQTAVCGASTGPDQSTFWCLYPLASISTALSRNLLITEISPYNYALSCLLQSTVIKLEHIGVFFLFLHANIKKWLNKE